MLVLIALLCLTAALRAHSQSAPVAGATSASPQAPAQTAPAAAPNAKPAPSPATKPRHVITNEELEPHAARGAAPKIDKALTSDAASLLTCDSTCEQDARNQLGYDADYEADWRAQIVEARHDLMADSYWRQTLAQAIQQGDSYCKFQLQQSRQLSSNRSDYQSRVQTARNAQYFENMDRALRQQMESTANRMQGHIQEVEVLSKVRAALMTVQANRVANRPCIDPEPR
jgi:hypothetical protein